MKRLAIATFVVLCLSNSAVAEELDTIFKKVNEYVAAQNYPKAIEELQWANKELEKKHNEKLGTLFPQELVGFKGDKLKAQAAMGFSTVPEGRSENSCYFDWRLSWSSWWPSFNWSHGRDDGWKSAWC